MMKKISMQQPTCAPEAPKRTSRPSAGPKRRRSPLATRPATNFEDRMLGLLPESALDMPLSELRLRKRAVNNVIRPLLASSPPRRTIRDYLQLGLASLRTMQHVGRTTVEEIRHAITGLAEQHAPEKAGQPRNISAVIRAMYDALPHQLAEILTLRCRPTGRLTLQEIGREKRLTRERIRQKCSMINEALSKYPANRAIAAATARIDAIIARNNGVAAIQDIFGDDFFISSTDRTLFFINYLTGEQIPQKYRLTHAGFITSLTRSQEQGIAATIRKVITAANYPQPYGAILATIRLAAGNLPTGYLQSCMAGRDGVQVIDGMALCPARATVMQRVKILLDSCDHPVTFAEIDRLYRDYYHARPKKIQQQASYYISGHMAPAKKYFIRVGISAIMSWQRYRMPQNIARITEACKEMLRDLHTSTNTQYLLLKLRHLGVDTADLNKYSLKSILMADPAFSGHGKFDIALREGNGQNRTQPPLPELIYNALLTSKKPLTAREIARRIKTRQHRLPDTVSQALSMDPRFIKTAPATYALPRHIRWYNRKRKIVLDAATRWITEKGTPITPAILAIDLYDPSADDQPSIYLITHILATAPDLQEETPGHYQLKEPIPTAQPGKDRGEEHTTS